MLPRAGGWNLWFLSCFWRRLRFGIFDGCCFSGFRQWRCDPFGEGISWIQASKFLWQVFPPVAWDSRELLPSGRPLPPETAMCCHQTAQIQRGVFKMTHVWPFSVSVRRPGVLIVTILIFYYDQHNSIPIIDNHIHYWPALTMRPNEWRASLAPQDWWPAGGGKRCRSGKYCPHLVTWESIKM